MNLHRTTSLASVGALTALALALVVSPRSVDAQSSAALDPNFQPVITRAGGFGSALEVQGDGKVVLAGGFNAVDGLARHGIVRLNSDGAVDPGFITGAICCGFSGGAGTEAIPPVSAMIIQSDGRILIGGTFTNVNGVTRNGLARLNTDGSLDTTFDPGTGLGGTSPLGTQPPVARFALQPDGKILVGGFFTTVNEVSRSGVARLNPNGAVDTAFDPGTALSIGFPDFGPLTGLAVLENGQILVGGAFRTFNDQPRPGLARLNADGSLDGSFLPELFQLGETPVPTVNAFVVQPGGKIVLSGSFEGAGLEFRSGLMRLNADGTPDPSFDAKSDSTVESYTVLSTSSSERTIAFRQFTGTDGQSHRAIVRLNADGSLDPALNLELTSGLGTRLLVRDVATQADGQLLVAGDFALASGAAQQGIVRVNAAGQADLAFDPILELAEGADANVLALAVQSDNQVLAGGAFTRINGVERTHLARLRPDGSVDPAFAPQVESDQVQSYVAAVAVQTDGKVLLGGLFSTVNGVGRNGIARLNADGTLDTSFEVGSGTGEGDPASGGSVGSVNAIVVQSDGKVLLAGNFTSLNGQPVPSLGRLNADGSVDVGFNSGVGVCLFCEPPEIRGLGVLSDGIVMVGGLFDRVDALFIKGIARLQPNGAVDFNFVPPIANEEEVRAIAVGSDGKTTAAITVIGAEGNETRFLRFNPDGAIDTSFQAENVVGQDATAIPVTALQVDSAGRLLLAGRFQRVGNTSKRGLARLNLDGSLDPTLDIGAGFGNGIFPPPRNVGPLVTALAVQPNGGVLAGGNFGTVDGHVRLGLARFPAGGSTPPPTGGAARLHGVARAPSGVVTMLVSGEAGQNYRIEASADLRTWTAVGTVAGGAAPQSFTDDSAATLMQRFYRAVTP